MASARALIRRRPRMAAAVGFGLAGILVPAVWFLPSVVARRDAVALVLYVAAPAVAAAVAGALAGPSLCDPGRTRSGGWAMLRGAVVATLALVIFAPIFAALFAWTAPGSTNIVGMTALVFKFSFLAVWWVVVIVGGAVGWLLHRIASRGDAR